MTKHNPDSPSLKELLSPNLKWLLFPIAGLWLITLIFALTNKSVSPFNALGVLFSGLAFVGYLLALLYQSQQIKMQRLQGERQSEQIEMQRKELALQREELALQREELKMHRAEFVRTANAQEESSKALQEQRLLMAQTARLNSLQAVQEGLGQWLKNESPKIREELRVADNYLSKEFKVSEAKSHRGHEGEPLHVTMLKVYKEIKADKNKMERIKEKNKNQTVLNFRQAWEKLENYVEKEKIYQHATNELIREIEQPGDFKGMGLEELGN